MLTTELPLQAACRGMHDLCNDCLDVDGEGPGSCIYGSIYMASWVCRGCDRAKMPVENGMYFAAQAHTVRQQLCMLAWLWNQNMKGWLARSSQHYSTESMSSMVSSYSHKHGWKQSYHGKESL